MISNRVWKFGDNINTDILAPGIYIKLPIEELASHCLESIDPSFSSEVSKGDIIVAGNNFGMGSSREQAAQVLKELGIIAVIAASFGGIFYRNAFNLGLPVIISRDVSKIDIDHQIKLDLEAGRIRNITTNQDLVGEKVPDNLLTLIEAGGLVPYLEYNLHNK
jgi:3-isopropylmalate/(R)-2-methylmalate dehydratase small subunit